MAKKLRYDRSYLQILLITKMMLNLSTISNDTNTFLDSEHEDYAGNWPKKVLGLQSKSSVKANYSDSD